MGDDVILRYPWNLRRGGDDYQEQSGWWSLAFAEVPSDAVDRGVCGGHRFMAVLSAVDQN